MKSNTIKYRDMQTKIPSMGKLLPFTFIGMLTLVLASCSSYQSVQDTDGIYSSVPTEGQMAEEETSDKNNYYKQYFNTKSQSIEAIPEEDVIFTDIDAYASTETLDERGNIIIEEPREAGYGAWGENGGNVTVNVYNGGMGWNDPFFGPNVGWGGFYGGWGAGFGWGNRWGWGNNWGWGIGNGWGWGGFNNPWYCAPFYGGYGGFYRPFYNSGYNGYGYAYANRGRSNRDAIASRSYNRGRSNVSGRSNSYGRNSVGRSSTRTNRSSVRNGSRTRSSGNVRSSQRRSTRATRPSVNRTRPTSRPSVNRSRSTSRSGSSMRGGSSRGRSSGGRSSGGSRGRGRG